MTQMNNQQQQEQEAVAITVPIGGNDESTDSRIDIYNNRKQQEEEEEEENNEVVEMTSTTKTIPLETSSSPLIEKSNDNESSTIVVPSEETTTQSTTTGTTTAITTCKKRLYDMYWTNEFVIHVIISIIIAKLYPPLGAIYLVPEITATWIAVILIFFMVGLSLQTSELTNALSRLYYNCTIQIYNFLFVSSVVYGIATALQSINIISTDLASGMIICSTLPMTINTVIVLTTSSGGDTAAAVCNAAIGNMIGIIVSPLLIILYLGVSSENDVNIGKVFYELSLRVIVPTIVGQLIQKFVPSVVQFTKKNKFLFKAVQQYTLTFIVYTVFCKTFMNQNNTSSISDIVLMIIFQVLLLIFFTIIAWYLYKYILYPNNPQLQIMALYGCTHKTVATGIPLINAIYGDSTNSNNSNLGLYTLPLLIWHPAQLIIGTFLTPYLVRYVQYEQKRLHLDCNDQPLITSTSSNVESNQQDDQEQQQVQVQQLVQAVVVEDHERQQIQAQVTSNTTESVTVK